MAGMNNMSAHKFNCSTLDLQILPESTYFVENIDWSDGEAVMIWVCLCVAILSTVVCVEGIVYLSRHIRCWSMKIQSAWQMALFGIFTSGSLFAMVIPRSSNNIDNVMSFFFALCQYELLNLFFDNYLKGENDIIQSYGTSRMIDMTQVQPCTRCCKCLPKFGITRVSLQRIRVMVYQSTLVHALNLIVTVILADDVDVTAFEQRETHSASIVLNVFTALSKIVAIYGLAVANQVFPEDLQDQYKTKWKVRLFTPLIVCFQLQAFFIQLLLGGGMIKCNTALGLSAAGRAAYIQHVCLIFEMFLLCLVARLVVWKTLVPEPDYEISFKDVIVNVEKEIEANDSEK